MFYIKLFDRDFAPATPTLLKLTVQRYSSAAVGGYEQAEIAITGPAVRLWEALRWLGYYVIIENEKANIVWAGMLTTADINLGGLQLGKTLDDMANRILVVYSADDPSGTPIQGRTSWGDDLESQNLYGIKELVQSQGDSDATQAAALRDTALTIIGKPAPTPTSIGQGSIGGTLSCKGLWHTTGWRIFNQPGGVVRYEDTGSFEHLLGWGLTSNQIAFYAPNDGISYLPATSGTGLEALRKDDQIIVSGAADAANNGVFTVDQTATIDAPQHIISAAISFNATDDILRAGGELGFVQANELLLVSGSSVGGNNRYYFAKSDLADDHITVTPATVTNSAAGPSVTITQGHSVTTTGALVTEYPANTVTLTALGSAIAQSWTLDVNVSWPVAEVYIRVKRVGTPFDSLRVSLRADAGGSPSSSSIEVVDTLGSTLSTDMEWLKIVFSNTFTPVYGTIYWLVVTRNGTNSPSDYYMVDLNEDAGYGSGTLNLWTGTAWGARSWGPDAKTADMPFQIWGHTETTGQISHMLTACNQFFDVFDFQNTSGIYSRLYRDADQTCQSEIENLLKAGTTAGKRLLANVTADRVVHIFAEPDYVSATAPLLSNDGVLKDISGQPYEPGKLPTGQWVTLSGVPANVDDFVGLAYQFVERAEWDVEAGKFSAIEFKGTPNPWDVTKLA